MISKGLAIPPDIFFYNALATIMNAITKQEPIILTL
jgi:hypothetical protein